jgi:hypothetical protein
MNCRCPAEGPGEAEGVRDLLGNRDRLLAAAHGLIGVAEMPQDTSEKKIGNASAVDPMAESSLAALSRIIKGDCLFKMGTRGNQLAEPKERVADIEMSIGKQLRVLQPFGHSLQFLGQAACYPDSTTHMVVEVRPIQSPEMRRRIRSDPTAQFERAGGGALDLR